MVPLGVIEETDKVVALQLGTFGRAKRKVEELQGVIAESKRAAH